MKEGRRVVRWLVLLATGVLLLAGADHSRVAVPGGRVGESHVVVVGTLPRGSMMLWYEDESLEDCGPVLNESGQFMDPKIFEAEKKSCIDVWQPALPHPTTPEQCEILRSDWNRSSAEEFSCSETRPDSVNDDGSHNGSH
jgi:hypothetical protein